MSTLKNRYLLFTSKLGRIKPQNHCTNPSETRIEAGLDSELRRNYILKVFLIKGRPEYSDSACPKPLNSIETLSLIFQFNDIILQLIGWMKNLLTTSDSAVYF